MNKMDDIKHLISNKRSKMGIKGGNSDKPMTKDECDPEKVELVRRNSGVWVVVDKKTGEAIGHLKEDK